MLLLNQPDTIHFLTCTLLCFIYFVVNTLLQFQLIDKKIFENRSQLLLMNGYALLMSTPLMPFFYREFAVADYPTIIISLFALSNLIWQLIYTNFHLQKDISNIIIALSLTNLGAWIVIYFLNYRFYALFLKYLNQYNF